jgi:branched-chain amino acid transport system substrate-binding protein
MFGRFIRVAAVVAVVLGLAAGAAFSAETVKIGTLVPLTGAAAADGLSALNSMKIAVDMVNSEGGILGKKLELVYYDDRADAKEAVALAHKLIGQDKVLAVVGGSYSMPSRAVATIFQEEEIPFVAAYAVHPDVTTAGDYCFRNGFLADVEGKAAAKVATELLGAKTIALLYSDIDFGRTLSKGFKDYLEKFAPEVKVVYDQAYPFPEKDFKPYLSKIKELAPDLIMVNGYYFQTGPILKQAKEMGVKALVLGEEGADSPKLVEIAGPSAAEGFMIVTNLNRDDERPVVQNFIREFKGRYGIDPDMVGASAYDGLMIIVDAMKRAGTTDAAKVRDAIAATSDFNGLTGVIKGFTPIGEVVKPVPVQIIKMGEYRYFAEITDPEIITPR